MSATIGKLRQMGILWDYGSTVSMDNRKKVVKSTREKVENCWEGGDDMYNLKSREKCLYT